MSYNGWMIPCEERERLFALFPPRYAVRKGSHITHALDIDKELLCDASIEIVGWVTDGGLEAFIVSVNGTTQRPDGQIYHLTYSYSEGRESKESNQVIASQVITRVESHAILTRGFYCSGDRPYVTSPLTA